MNLIPRNFFLDDLFDDFLASKDTNNLKCDIYEKDGKYHIEMDAIGFNKDDMNISYDNGYLTVELSTNEEKEDKKKNYIRRERYQKDYKRTFYVGETKSEEITANFKDGVLKVTVPKQEKIESKKKIEIE
ncbi:MAG TPA: Hsp20 family protein [Bacilli bacterium]|nr:Hsp20 family protein [Bacilli bacterium]